MNAPQNYTVTGAFPDYTVTDDQGRSHAVRWTCQRGLWSKLPICDCTGHDAAPHACGHTQAACAHRNRQKAAAAREAGVPVVTGTSPDYSVAIGTEAHAVAFHPDGTRRCSCDPQRANSWPDQCIHAASAESYDVALRLAAKGDARGDNIECAETGIVRHGLLIPYYQARERRRSQGRAP